MAKSLSQEQKKDISDIKRYAHIHKKNVGKEYYRGVSQLIFFLSIIFLGFVTRVGFFKSALKSTVTRDF